MRNNTLSPVCNRTGFILKPLVKPVFILSLLTVASLTTARAAEPDWSGISSTTVKVFYPGTTSWEFLRNDDHGTGAAPVKTFKKACADCHVGDSGEFDIKADQIISGSLKKVDSGEPLEPEPLSGMPGFLDVNVQAAYDAENIYLRFQWQGSGASVADPSLAEDDKADSISVQINNTIKSFALYGCFMTCHDDQTGMPYHRGEEVTLYGYYTREKDDSMKSADALSGYHSKGLFVDLWVAAFAGNEVKATDEYVLGERVKDGQNDLSATGSYENGQYTVVITRKLATGDGDDLELKDGKEFTAGIAVHDNKNTGRKHYVSFPVTIGLSTSADVAAQKQ